jgi:hypothetical protein
MAPLASARAKAACTAGCDGRPVFKARLTACGVMPSSLAKAVTVPRGTKLLMFFSLACIKLTLLTFAYGSKILNGKQNVK